MRRDLYYTHICVCVCVCVCVNVCIYTHRNNTSYKSYLRARDWESIMSL